MNQAARIIARYLASKGSGGVRLVPDYTKALDALKGGNPKPLQEFARQTLKVIFPNEDFKPPDWYYGLGTAKRNAINGLQKDLNRYLMEVPLLVRPEAIPSAVALAETWAKALRTLEIASVAIETEEIQRGPFTVVAMPGVTLTRTSMALEALDEAVAKIRPKFPKVLYGKVFLSNHLDRKSAAWYVYMEDKFYLDVNASKRFNDVYTIIHELGHRHEHKFLSKANRAKFWALSTSKVFEKTLFDDKLRRQVAQEVIDLAKAKAIGRPLSKMSPDLLVWLKRQNARDVRPLVTQFLNGKISEDKVYQEIMGTEDVEVETGKLLHGPLAVTPYGATKPSENYAEAFAHYVLGMDMPQEFVSVLSEEAK